MAHHQSRTIRLLLAGLLASSAACSGEPTGSLAVRARFPDAVTFEAPARTPAAFRAQAVDPGIVVTTVRIAAYQDGALVLQADFAARDRTGELRGLAAGRYDVVVEALEGGVRKLAAARAGVLVEPARTTDAGEFQLAPVQPAAPRLDAYAFAVTSQARLTVTGRKEMFTGIRAVAASPVAGVELAALPPDDAPAFTLQISLQAGDNEVRIAALNPEGVAGEPAVLRMRLAGDPAFASLLLANAAADGYVNAAERASALPLVAGLQAEDARTSDYTVAPAAADCAARADYAGAVPAANDARLTSDGAWKVCVRLTGWAGAIKYGAGPIFVLDTLAPGAPGTPAPAADPVSGPVTVTWTAAPDVGAGVQAYRLESRLPPDTAWMLVAQTADTAAAADLADGLHELRVRAFDLAGNLGLASAAVSLAVDKTPPAFASLPLAYDAADGYLNAAERLNFTPLVGTLAAAGYVQADYAPAAAAAACAAAAFETLLPASDDARLGADGDYRVCVRLIDAVGWVTYGESPGFTLDTAPPETWIDAPLADAISPAFAGAAGGAADGTASGVAGVEVAFKRLADGLYWNGAAFSGSTPAWLPASGTTLWSYTLPALADGAYALTSRASDAAGNIAAASAYRLFTRDAAPPVIADFTAPTPVSAAAIVLALAVTDLTAIEMRVSEDPGFGDAVWAPYAATPPFTLGAGDGAKTLYAEVRDAAGNVTGATAVTVLDTTAPAANRFVAVASAWYHACGIALDGTLQCWGANEAGQLGDGSLIDKPYPVPDGSGAQWRQVSTGFQHTCAVRTDDTLWCWGANAYGQLGDGGTLASAAPVLVSDATQGWRQVAAGQYHTCALRGDDTLWCWGRNNVSQLGDDSTTTRLAPHPLTAAGGGWASLSAVRDHACALKADGGLWCWGVNTFGQLGDGGTTTRRVPTREGTAANDWAAVAAGGQHTCARKTGGALYCWGYNARGQLGDGTTVNAPLAVRVGADNDWTGVAAGGVHTCAVKTGGALYCWGSNERGRLGHAPPARSVTTPTREATAGSDFVAVAAGQAHACGRAASGAVRCWGDDMRGQLARGTLTPPETKPVPGLAGVASLAVADYHLCALTAESKLGCWGDGGGGSLGGGSYDSYETPLAVDAAATYVAVSGGYDEFYGYQHSCGIRDDGSLWCWGANTFGEIGDGTLTDALYPTQVSGAGPWAKVSAHGTHTCAIDAAGALWCWGRNTHYQLGDGSTLNRSLPVRIGAAADWTWITGTQRYRCGIRGGMLFCWGSATSGAMGNGAGPHAAPVQVGTDTDWSRVEAGGSHTCALKTDGSLWCWGKNAEGALGLGSTTAYGTPQRVGAENDWVQLAVGGQHAEVFQTTCAIKSDGSLWCWGTNWDAAVGDGTLDNRLVPTQVGAGRAWTAVGTSSFSTCAIDAASRLWCWGAHAHAYGGAGAHYRAAAEELGAFELRTPAHRIAASSLPLALAAFDLLPPLSMEFGGDVQFGGFWQTFVPTSFASLTGGEGVREVSVRFADALNNQSPWYSLRVTVDATPPPTLAFSVPASGATVAAIPSPVRGVARDDDGYGGAVTGVSVKLVAGSGESWSESAGLWVIPETWHPVHGFDPYRWYQRADAGAANGVYTLTARAWDEAGNLREAAITFTLSR